MTALEMSHGSILRKEGLFYFGLQLEATVHQVGNMCLQEREVTVPLGFIVTAEGDGLH